MAIDFPASPTNGQTFTSGALVYTYDGTKWTAQPAGVTGGTKIEVGNTKAEIVDTGSDGRFVVTTEGTERARIDSSGRLLVGTTTSQAIAVGSGGAQFQSVAANPVSFSRFSNDLFGTVISIGKSRGTSPGSFTVVSNNDALGEIRFAGSDGTDLSSIAAQISAEVDGTPGNDDMPGRLVFSTTADGASSPTERVSITSAGTLAIPATAAANLFGSPRLAVNGDDTNASAYFRQPSTTAKTHIEFRNGNGVVGSISTNGSATAYNTSSDYRLKESVVPLVGAIDRLQQIPVHRFNFIADPDKTVDGFLAHEAQEIVPECVTGTKDEVDDEGNPIYQGIDQSKLVPLLTAALQEAIAKIEDLEGRLTAAGL
jgi:hypothetical protein